MRKLILLLTAFASPIIAAPTFGAPAIPITTAPYNITAPGKYVLANDITWTGPNGGAAGIVIYADNVTLDLGGHTVTANQGDGIVVVGNYARISNGTIIASHYGVWILTGSYNAVSGLTITVGPGGGVGVTVEGAPYTPGTPNTQYNQVSDCTIIGVSPTAVYPQQSAGAFQIYLTSNNSIQNCVLEGKFFTTILEDDQDSSSKKHGGMLIKLSKGSRGKQKRQKIELLV
jgi:hypothetical protein